MMTATIDRFQSQAAPLASPLPGVSASAWECFRVALEVQPIQAVSPSGGFGSYDLRPRRLVELGYAKNLRSTRTGAGRQVYECEFIAPWTEDRFLENPMAQLRALTRSMVLYHKGLTGGDLERPKEMSLAGALVVLHRGGKGALKGWPKLFDDTRRLYEAARGAF